MATSRLLSTCPNIGSGPRSRGGIAQRAGGHLQAVTDCDFGHVLACDIFKATVMVGVSLLGRTLARLRQLANQPDRLIAARLGSLRAARSGGRLLFRVSPAPCPDALFAPQSSSQPLRLPDVRLFRTGPPWSLKFAAH